MTNLIQPALIVFAAILAAVITPRYFKKCPSKFIVLWCIMLVFMTVFIAGCSSGEPVKSSKPSSEAEKKESSADEHDHDHDKPAAGKAQAEVKKTGKKASENPAFKQLAFEGKMDGVELKVGSTYQEIIDKLGKPQKQSAISGGEVLTYGDASYIILPTTKKVVCIMVGTGKSLYGVKVGMKPSEIKQILGDPDYEDHDDLTGIWNLCYNAGNYTLIFNYAEENGPTIMAFLQSATF